MHSQQCLKIITLIVKLCQYGTCEYLDFSSQYRIIDISLLNTSFPSNLNYAIHFYTIFINNYHLFGFYRLETHHTKKGSRSAKCKNRPGMGGIIAMQSHCNIYISLLKLPTGKAYFILAGPPVFPALREKHARVCEPLFCQRQKSGGQQKNNNPYSAAQKAVNRENTALCTAQTAKKLTVNKLRLKYALKWAQL